MALKQILKSFRKKIKMRLQSHIKADLRQNRVIIPKGGVFRLEIKGKNNQIILPETISSNSILKINIYGDNNIIRIASCNNLILKIKIGDSGSQSNNCSFTIDEHTSAEGLTALLFEHNSSVRIGKDCMFSGNILLWCTDMHTVTNLEGRPTNQGREVVIGNHVWIGREVHIAKNTRIPDNSIVGWCSNVTSRFDEPNVVIAGNPASIVKKNINWNRERFDVSLATFNERNSF